MALTPLAITTTIFSAVFVLGGFYFYATTQFTTERKGRQAAATALLLFPLYGIIEFGGLVRTELIPLILLAIAGILLVYGFWYQYSEVVDR